jgi:hypothetical protein
VAPPKPKGPPKDTPPKRGRPSNDSILEQQLAAVIAVVFGAGSVAVARPLPATNEDGVATTVPGLHAPGTVSLDLALIAEAAQPLAHGLVAASKTNEHLRTALDKFGAVGAYGELTTVAAGLALAIAANHGVLPPAMTDVLAAGNGAATDS